MSTLEVFTHWSEYIKVRGAINFVKFAGHELSVWEGSGLINRLFIIRGEEKAIELFKAIRFIPERKYYNYFHQNS